MCARCKPQSDPAGVGMHAEYAAKMRAHSLRNSLNCWTHPAHSTRKATMRLARGKGCRTEPTAFPWISRSGSTPARSQRHRRAKAGHGAPEP